MQTAFDMSRTATVLLFLFYASWSDYKTREVSNKVWILFAPIAFALTFTELILHDSSQLPFYGICFGITSLLAIALFYSGAFGGADAKALMCIALALPFYPEKLFASTIQEISPISQLFFPMSIFNNSVLLAAATALYMFLHNVFWHRRAHERLFEYFKGESVGKKILVAVTGYRTSVSKLKDKWHLYPLEDIENLENGFKRKLTVIPKDENRNETVERLAEAVKSGKINDAIWATPGLPMLIFITVGLVIALFFGDIIWICLRLLLG